MGRVGTSLLWALLAGLALLYVALLDPARTGMIYDDGIYLLGAQALATGKGYVMLHFPGEPPIVKYPPLFPLLLAPVWWLFPHFPGNITLFKLIPVSLMLAALGLLGVWLLRDRRLPVWLTLTILLLAGLEVRTLLYVVNLMSEPLYLLLSAAILLYAGRLETVGRRQILVLALLTALLIYTRSIGVAMIPALALWLWMRHRRQFGLAFAALTVLSCLPWFIWAQSQSPPVMELMDFRLASFNRTYFQEWLYGMQTGYAFWQAPASLPTALGMLAVPALKFHARHLDTLWPGSAGHIALGLGLAALTAMAAGGARAWYRWQVSPLGLYLAFYLLGAFLWPVEHERLLVVVMPFLWLLLFSAVSPPRQAVVTGLVLAQFLWIQAPLLQSWLAVARSGEMVANLPFDLWADFREGFAALCQDTPPGSVLWTRYHGVYPLYAERGTFAYNFAPLSPARSPEEGLAAMRGLLGKSGVQYLMLEPAVGNGAVNEPYDPLMAALIARYPQHFEHVFSSTHNAIHIFRFIPASAQPGTKTETQP